MCISVKLGKYKEPGFSGTGADWDKTSSKSSSGVKPRTDPINRSRGPKTPDRATPEGAAGSDDIRQTCPASGREERSQLCSDDEPKSQHRKGERTEPTAEFGGKETQPESNPKLQPTPGSRIQPTSSSRLPSAASTSTATTPSLPTSRIQLTVGPSQQEGDGGIEEEECYLPGRLH